MPKVTHLVRGRYRTEPRHIWLESMFLTKTVVLFGQKILEEGSRILFTLDQSLPECMAHSRPSISVCLNRHLALTVSEGLMCCGGRRWGLALFHLPLKPSLLEDSLDVYSNCHTILCSSLVKLSVNLQVMPIHAAIFPTAISLSIWHF